MNLKSLTDLNLDTNNIETAKNFTGLPNILTLKLRQNKLKNCEGLSNMPKLHTLHLVYFQYNLDWEYYYLYERVDEFAFIKETRN